MAALERDVVRRVVRGGGSLRGVDLRQLRGLRHVLPQAQCGSSHGQALRLLARHARPYPHPCPTTIAVATTGPSTATPARATRAAVGATCVLMPLVEKVAG